MGIILSVVALAIVMAVLRQSSAPKALPYHAKGEVQGPVLILTAHPDDECMFFAPTILSLIAKGQKVVALCLSVGNQDGLGIVRERELHASYKSLGVHEVASVDQPSLADNITREWEASVVADATEAFVVKHGVQTILTFDKKGISGHPNHIALPKGAAFLAGRRPDLNLKVLSLITIPLPMKYSGILLPLFSHISTAVGAEKAHTEYVSSIGGYVKALRAMQHHQSQLVWFRWLYVLFSTYMWVNEWEVVVQ